MSDPHTDLVDRVRSLERTVAALEVRIAGLETEVRGAMIFVALAFFGAALIATTRLRR